MEFQYITYSLLLIFSSLISIFLSWSAWKRRKVNGALYLCLLFIFVTEWSLTSALEISSTDIVLKIIYAKLSYVGMILIPPLWFLFTLDYTQNQEVIKKPRVIILFLIPIFIIYLVLTNDWHGLIWPTITPLYTADGLFLIYQHGPAAIFSAIYSFILILAGLIMVGQNLFKTSHLYQKQAMLIFLAALIPLLSNSIYAANLYPFHFDPTPLIITISGILIVWSIFWYKLLDIMPPAYKGLFGSMKNGVVVLDTYERIMDLNPAAEKLLSLNKHCIGLKARDELEIWDKIAPNGRYDGSIDLKLDSSKNMWIEVQFTPVYSNRLFSGWIYIFEDITKRKGVENRIAKSEKKYRELADLLPQTVFETDENAKLTFMNVYGFEMFGYTQKHLEEGLNILELIIEEERSISKGKITEVLNGNGSGDEYTAKKGDGTLFPIIIHSNPIFNRGIFEGFRGIIIDISDIKDAEEKIMDSLKEKEVLLQEIHHRVKNNMQIISSLLSLQANHTDNQETVDILKESRGRVKSMAMIHEKLYHGQNIGKLNMTEYLNNLVSDIVKFYSNPSSDIRIDVDVEDIKLNIDTAIPMGLMVNEIVSNSTKYAFPNKSGMITLKLKYVDDYYLLYVSDNGKGFPKDLNIQESSTLGLKLVKSLAIQLEGELEIKSNNGTSFLLKFKELKYNERL
ncbi:MAG: PAS domain S-box protein [Methanobacterium sp. ERen5]|nr:MAG: PAS domain S-box protein [Methanobacterium sp. ERen5]